MNISHIFKKESEFTKEDKKLQEFFNLLKKILQFKKNKEFRVKYFSSYSKYMAIISSISLGLLSIFISPAFLLSIMLLPFILILVEHFHDFVQDRQEERQADIIIEQFLNSLKTKEDVFSFLYHFQKEIQSYGTREEFNLYGDKLINEVKKLLQLYLEHVEKSKISDTCFDIAKLFDSFYQKATTIAKKEDFESSFESFVLEKEQLIHQNHNIDNNESNRNIEKEKSISEQEQELVKYL